MAVLAKSNLEITAQGKAPGMRPRCEAALRASAAAMRRQDQGQGGKKARKRAHKPAMTPLPSVARALCLALNFLSTRAQTRAKRLATPGLAASLCLRFVAVCPDQAERFPRATAHGARRGAIISYINTQEKSEPAMIERAEGEPLIRPSTTEHPLYPAVVEACRTIYDPEIPVNIFDLGLIYGIEISPENAVKITMTLTAPACPVAGEMPGWVADAVGAVPGVGQVDVDLVFDPPWNMDRMTEAARLELGFL